MQQISSNYSKHTSSNPLQQYLINQFYAQLLSVLPKLPGKSILDVGCGEGFTLSRIARTWPDTYTLEGIDVSATAIATGKEQAPELHLQVGSIYDLPYADNAFDIALCNEVLEHLEHPADALQELHRVAKEYVLLSVPQEPLFRLANFLRGKNLSRWGNDIEHIQHWSTLSFITTIKKHGFEPVSIKTPFPWTLVTARVVKS